jgi:23S rRNA (cytidine1920-2'-O)/16S rRNA (cytidine1409-2'-O)-methyltransferase
LIKPQFEAGRAALNKKGIVKDPRDRILAIRRVLSVAREVGFVPMGLAPSPILGGDGNEEYLLLLSTAGCDAVRDELIEKTVKERMVIV